MKHGVAFRKFSRTMSHRDLMLRNLVTSLFEHQRIRTTLPKALDTARLAEKIITMGKKADPGSHTRAANFLLKPIALKNLFETFSKRYAERPGGYTRVLKLGNRQGDNAPQAVLELVDNPEDLRWEMTARAVGWEIVQNKIAKEKLSTVVTGGAQEAKDILEAEQRIEYGEKGGLLRPKTRWNVQKLLRFRGAEALEELSGKAAEHADKLLATPVALKAMFDKKKEKDARNFAPRTIAGQKLVGETRSVLDLAQGDLGYQRKAPSNILTMQKAFRLKSVKRPAV
ncbi:hypothetical protein D9611_006878 [Ephemerocybe angulata]|uniref:Ribosomal protein L17 n=1 Tax=Ephemerocybe angulata TaxID=980116 RepID=A0A8H5AZY2_9AGAR|nr:hypothetical protein D9611_006878 [Tulosesus angulatus]